MHMLAEGIAQVKGTESSFKESPRESNSLLIKALFFCNPFVYPHMLNAKLMKHKSSHYNNNPTYISMFFC